MKARRYKVDIYINLNPPNVFKDINKHRVVLIKTILLNFVPYPGLRLRFVGNYSEQEREHWSPLMHLASGPKGAVGHGSNNEIWPLDAVFYDVEKTGLRHRASLKCSRSNNFMRLKSCFQTVKGFDCCIHPSVAATDYLYPNATIPFIAWLGGFVY